MVPIVHSSPHPVRELLPAMLVAVLLLWAPLPHGSARAGGATAVEVIAFLALAAAFLPAGAGRGPRWVWPALASVSLAAIGLLGFVQTVPVVAGLVEPLSSTHAVIRGRADEVLQPLGLATTPAASLAPEASRRAALQWIAVAACLVAAAAAVGRRRGRIVLAGALLAAVVFQLLYGGLRIGVATIWGEELPQHADRLRGTFPNADHFSLFVEMALAASFAWGWWALQGARREVARERRLAWLVPPALAGVALFFAVAYSGSRAGLVAAIVALLASGLVLAATGSGWRSAALGGAAALLGIVAVAAIGSQQGFGRWLATSGHELTWNARLAAYRGTIELWRRFPWLGSGLGSFREAFPLVQPPEAPKIWVHAHNDVLELLATTGVAGAALFAAGLATLTVGLLRRVRRGSSGGRAIALTALGALAAAGFHSWFDFGLTIPANAVTLAVLCGAALGAAGPEAPAPVASRAGARGARWLGVVASLTLAALALHGWDVARTARHDARRRLAEAGVSQRHPELLDDVERAEDRAHLDLIVARALFAEQLDGSWLRALPEDEHRTGLERASARLEQSRDLAAAALARRPGSWEAAMIVGGAELTARFRAGDPQLLTRSDSWERPLRLAAELAPAADEPLRLLAIANVLRWPQASASEKAASGAELRRAFRDPQVMLLLGESWLAVAEDTDEAFAWIPDDPGVWRQVLQILARRGEWEELARAHERWDAALLAELDRRIAGALEQLDGGDRRGARTELLWTVARARQDRRYAAVLTRALESAPAGVAPSQLAEQLAPLLDWTLEQCVVVGCPLGAAAMARLAAAAEIATPELEARAALASGDLVTAHRHERRAAAVLTEAWAPYWIQKARRALAAGEPAEARAALAGLPAEARRRPIVLALLRDAEGAAGAGAGAARALAASAATAWRGADWEGRGRRHQLELVPAAAGLLVVEFDVVPPRGAVVEVRQAGSASMVAVINPGGELVVPIAEPGEPHVLELQSLAGGAVVPGAVRLE